MKGFLCGMLALASIAAALAIPAAGSWLATHGPDWCRLCVDGREMIAVGVGLSLGIAEALALAGAVTGICGLLRST